MWHLFLEILKIEGFRPKEMDQSADKLEKSLWDIKIWKMLKKTYYTVFSFRNFKIL